MPNNPKTLPSEPRQTHAEYWRAREAEGLTSSQLKAILNSLPRIVPISILTKAPSK